ncbi:MAG: histidine kinase, partial [Streptococcus mitis]|nr:histidine kinase [Streptococcus mitis]
MEMAWKIVYTFLIAGLELFIFFKVDGIGLTLERVFKSFLFKILL